MSLEAIVATLGELTGDAICILRDPGPGAPMELVWWNAELVQFTGFAPDALRGRSATILHGDLIAPDVRAELHAQITARGRWRGELPCQRADGSCFWADVSLRADLPSDDGEQYVLKVYRDIDAARQREAAMAEREAALRAAGAMETRLRSAVEAFQGSFAIYDPDLTLLLCNSRYKTELTDRPDDIQPGMSMWEVTRVGVRSGRLVVLPGLDEEGMVARIVEETCTKSGIPQETRFANGRVCLSLRTHSDNGDYIVSRTDITEVTEQRQRLQEMNAALSDTLRERETLLQEVEQARERLSCGLETLPDAFAIFDRDYDLVICNHLYAAEWTDDISEVTPGTAFRDLVRMGVRNGRIDPGDTPLEAFLDEIIPSVFYVEDVPVLSEFRPGHFVRSLRRRAPNGDLIVLRTDVTEVVQKAREVEAVNAQLRQALEEGRALAEAAQRSEYRLTAAIDAIPDGFAMFDEEENLVAFNASFSEIYPEGRIRKGMPMQRVADMAAAEGVMKLEPGTHRENPFSVPEDWDVPGRLDRLRTGDGRHFEVSRTMSEIRDKIVFRREVTDLMHQTEALRETQRRMEHQATHDALTGVRNRHGLGAALGALLDDAARGHAACRACVLHVDLDRFKGVNDTLGHAAGDFVLRRVSELLRELAGEGAVIARVGGDEFVIALCSRAPETEGMALARSIVTRVAEPMCFEGRDCRIGASVGVAAAPEGGETAADLLVNSDIALYRAKHSGRNQAQLFDAALRREVEDQTSLADALLAGLPRGEFIPVYQPQFDARTLDLIGLEALVRWRHPEKGLLSPAAFLGIAEGLGAVAQIDEVVFDAALRDCEALLDRGIHIPAISFNVSCDRIRTPDFLQSVRRLTEHPIDIGIELLESTFIEEDDQFLVQLDSLRDLGMRIELDDFGSGHASIVALTRIGAHRLKIDQRLVRPIEESVAARRVIKACIDIGAALEIEVLAEGVETEGQAAILRDLGCAAFQGYLFAKPMPIDDLAECLAAEDWRGARRAG